MRFCRSILLRLFKKYSKCTIHHKGEEMFFQRCSFIVHFRFLHQTFPSLKICCHKTFPLIFIPMSCTNVLCVYLGVTSGSVQGQTEVLCQGVVPQETEGLCSVKDRFQHSCMQNMLCMYIAHRTISPVTNILISVHLKRLVEFLKSWDRSKYTDCKKSKAKGL